MQNKRKRPEVFRPCQAVVPGGRRSIVISMNAAKRPTRCAHTLPEEASYRSQICNRDSKQDLARCQIRGRAPGIQRRFGTDGHVVCASTLGNEGEVWPDYGGLRLC